MLEILEISECSQSLNNFKNVDETNLNVADRKSPIVDSNDIQCVDSRRYHRCPTWIIIIILWAEVWEFLHFSSSFAYASWNGATLSFSRFNQYVFGSYFDLSVPFRIFHVEIQDKKLYVSAKASYQFLIRYSSYIHQSDWKCKVTLRKHYYC